jgi:uncharacterized protein (DUF1499 family)
MPYWKIAAVVAVCAVVAWALIMFTLSALAKKPDDLGVKEGRLAACPSSPNCTCSQDTDEHAIEPFAFTGEPADAWAKLKRVLAEHPRTRIVSESDDYLHAECTSLLFRFVDDVEFLMDREKRLIHVRSASRAGRSDLGVNRKRVEQMRQAFAEG